MNNTEQKRFIMIQYSIKLIELAKANNYILYYRSLECRNIVWDCQQALLEWEDYKVPEKIRAEFFEKDELAYSYARQLLNIAASAVAISDPLFNDVSLADLNNIILI